MNGQVQPRLALMPETGKWTAPQNHWLVWPRFAIRGHGLVGISGRAEGILSLGMISQPQILGRPCHRWLGRR